MRSGPTITEHLPAEELKRLLLDIAAGERDALAELYRHTQTAVYGLALSYLKNFHDAQDLTQDVYVHVWNHAGQYRPVGSAMGWLLTVCRNLCGSRSVRRPLTAKRGMPSLQSPAGSRMMNGYFYSKLLGPWGRKNGGSFCSTPPV